MTTRVPQRTGHDCGVCSLAMLLSISYEKAYAAIKRHRPESYDEVGCYYPDLINAAKDLGVTTGTWWRRDHFKRNNTDAMPMSAAILETEVSKGSLRSHFVYMDVDGMIHDPHPPRDQPRPLRGYKVWRSLYRKD